MNGSYFYNKYAGIFFAVLLLIAFLMIGCGKSADELYNESIQLINNKETLDKGLKTLIKFENSFPQDERTPEAILTIASIYQNKDNYEEAANNFNRLIDKYPNSPEAFKGKFLLGYMYYDISDNIKAGEILTDFISEYPDSELTFSAEMLLKNIGLPVEEWPVIKELEGNAPKENGSQPQ